jgi:hypothetical protein
MFIVGVMRIACIQIASCIAALLVTGAASAAAPKRFYGSINFAGPGHNPLGLNNFHSFVVGSRLDATFLDQTGNYTRYRFCWRQRGGDVRRCWKGNTHQSQTRSIIHAFAPRRPGSYLATWYVSGHPVAGWRFRIVTGG